MKNINHNKEQQPSHKKTPSIQKRAQKTMLSLLFGTTIVSSCRKEDENGYIEFLIKKDNHECEGIRFKKSDNRVDFNFIFDENCLYEDSILNNGPGWNKLYRIGEANPLNNSARIGWRSANHKIILGYFVHNNGAITKEAADTIDVGEEGTGSIQYKGDKVQININKKSKIFDSQEPDSPMKCFPYFGGESTAPHNITIRIKETSELLQKTLEDYHSPFPEIKSYTA